MPKRGERRNEPAYVRYVAEAIANLRGETLEAIAAQTTKNACELFGFATWITCRDSFGQIICAYTVLSAQLAPTKLG